MAARRLEIAAVTTAAESFVPGMMRSFAAEHPDVELTLVVGNRQEVLERVLSHSADVAITGKPPGDDRLLAEPFMENAIVCITAPDDPAAGDVPPTWAGCRIGAGSCASQGRERARWASSSSPITALRRRH